MVKTADYWTVRYVVAAKIDGPLEEIKRRSDAEASDERKRNLSIVHPPFFPLPFLPGIIFRSAAFFLRVQEIETRSEMLRDAWLLKRGGVMTRTICSGVSTRLFLFSSTAESASYLFLLLLLRTPRVPFLASSLSPSTCSCLSTPFAHRRRGRPRGPRAW